MYHKNIIDTSNFSPMHYLFKMVNTKILFNAHQYVTGRDRLKLSRTSSLKTLG